MPERMPPLPRSGGDSELRVRRTPVPDYFSRPNPEPGRPMSGINNIPRPQNEPVLSYAPGTPDRTALKGALGSVGNERPDIPVVIGDREIQTGETYNVTSPHCHSRVLATLHHADQAAIDAAVASAVETQRDWAHWRFEDRA